MGVSHSGLLTVDHSCLSLFQGQLQQHFCNMVWKTNRENAADAFCWAGNSLTICQESLYKLKFFGGGHDAWLSARNVAWLQIFVLFSHQ